MDPILQRPIQQGMPIPGSAEYLSTKLTAPGPSCPHRGNRPSSGQAKYPTVLAFFHRDGASISYLETNRLCGSCLDAAVPSGFNVWSLYNALTKENGGLAPSQLWLKNAKSSSKCYPAAFQAGTEAFSALGPSARKDPVTVPRPSIPGASESWRWIRRERKPFYLDHLHLVQHWTLASESAAASDSALSIKTGSVFDDSAVAPRPKTKTDTGVNKQHRAQAGQTEAGRRDISEVIKPRFYS